MMKWFYNMKIGKKLIVSFLMMAVIAGAVGVVGIIQINQIDQRYDQLYEGYGVSLGYLAKISEGYQMRQGLLKDLIIETDSANEKLIMEKIKAADNMIAENLEAYKDTIMTKEDQAIFNELDQLLIKYNPLKDGFITHALAKEDDQALGMMSGEGATIVKNVEESIESIIQYNTETGRKLSDEYNQTTISSTALMIGIVLFSMGLAIILGVFISRIIGRPIRFLVKEADKIADGNLDVSFEVTTKDEVGHLSKSFLKMTDNLNDAIYQISEAAVQVASGSKQVSDSGQVLSSGATEQASSIEELTASMEEVSSQTAMNAQNANQANILAEEAKENAKRGNEQMKEMLIAMEDINQSSGNISKIIKVIDDIAFQTNILALNAAVEAARAGQHGKGFAVVAEEVRNLAARSANAAKETTDMIESSIKKVDGGTKTAKQTAEALKMIVEGVTKVADLVGNIATASNEQASGINQINQGILQISSVVQTNSATSEESASASEELASQAELLKEQVSRFKLKGQGFTSSPKEIISQDVLDMLNNDKYNNLKLQHKMDNRVSSSTGGSHQIKLSDNEFGKY